MDVLSDVLRTVRLSGSVFFTAEMTSPWAVSSPPGELLAPVLMPGAQWFVLFHVVARGGCVFGLPGGQFVRLEEGDVAIFPHGQSHVMADRLECTGSAVSVVSLVSDTELSMPIRLEHGGGGASTELVCGFLGGDDRFDPLVSALPPLLCVRTGEGGVRIEACQGEGDAGSRTSLRLARESPIAEWLETSLRCVMHEAEEVRAGGTSILGRLAEVLFVQVLRSFVEQSALQEGGWLAGLRDPRLGHALALLHGEPAHGWTVEELGRRVGLSRSALGERFAEVLGEPPMRYLTRWRMHLARRLLRDPRLSLAEVGARVGYESEAAFHRAFKRHVGDPPGAWRKRALEAATPA